MPWDKIQTYFFGESSLEDSIQVAIAAHSGIPEANVHNVLEGMPDGITIDCCVSNGEDLQGLPDEFIRHCASWLIVGTDNMPSLDLGGVAHMYVIN
jgi:hypothetical protein